MTLALHSAEMLKAGVLATAMAFAPACGGSQSSQGASESDPGAAYPPAPEGAAAQGSAQHGQGPQAQAPAQQPPTTEVTSEEVQTFSNIQVQLLELQQQFSARAQAGEDPQALQGQLDVAAAEVIEESGLTIERYQQIAQAVLADESLRRRIDAAMQAGG